MALLHTALTAIASHASVGNAFDARSRAGVQTWLELLVEWNARTDLTAARNPEELVDLMLADALVLAPRIDPGARVVDVGTGAGAPGLALALLRPDLRMTLVEPTAKRTSFLRMVLGSVSRADIAIERVRGDALANRRAWDVALSRATLGPPAWLTLASTLAAPGGDIWVFLAREEPPQHPRAALVETVSYEWPLTGAHRTLARYRLP